MARALRVTIPFAEFDKGDLISDPALVDKHLAESQGHVVPVNHTEDPEPPAEPDEPESHDKA